MPDIRFTKGHKGRKRAVTENKPAPQTVPGGAVPRLSRLMALAIRFDGLLRDGVVKDCAELARLDLAVGQGRGLGRLSLYLGGRQRGGVEADVVDQASCGRPPRCLGRLPSQLLA